MSFLSAREEILRANPSSTAKLTTGQAGGQVKRKPLWRRIRVKRIRKNTARRAGEPNFGGYRGQAPYTLNPLKIIFKIGSRFVV